MNEQKEKLPIFADSGTNAQVVELLESISLKTVEDLSLTLVGDLGLDSLKMVMLLVMIEDSFEIELDESDMNPFALITVEDVIDLVAKYTVSEKEEPVDA